MKCDKYREYSIIRKSQHLFKKAHISDGLHSASIVSLFQLYNDDCIVILAKNDINILKDYKLILKVYRNKTYGLWDIPISRPLRHQACSIITQNNNKKYLIQYLHGFCFRPTPITLLKTINNGNFLTWPGLNNQQLLKHLLPIIATALEHLDRKRKNFQSTKQV